MRAWPNIDNTIVEECATRVTSSREMTREREKMAGIDPETTQ